MRFERGVDRVWAALLLAACSCLPVAAAESLAPCRVPGLRNEVLCGQVLRPLDPARPEGVTIAVHYVVVPSVARRKLADPVFLLAGGPGQSAIDVAASVMPLFYRLNQRRDIVFVDQRGTGRSAPLECEDPRRQSLAAQSDPSLQLAQLRQCRDALQKLPHGDLRFFTTPLAVQDLDAVRRQLGAAQINLVGVSYGTRVGLDALRQFPQTVRRMVLDGVAPPDMALPASFSTDGQAVLDAVFTACEGEAACARAYPALRGDWARALARLPQRLTLVHPLTGSHETLTLTRDMVLSAVRAPLYLPLLSSALPLAIHAAAQGEWQALMTLPSALSSGRRGAVAMGMHFSVVCSEDVPRLALSRDVPGTDFGGESARLYRQVCAEWPRGELPAAFYTLTTTRSPVLLLAGGLDPATPPRHAARVAQALGPLARQIVVPNAGHGLLSLGCMADVVTRFIDAADAAAALAVDARCVDALPRPPAFEATR